MPDLVPVRVRDCACPDNPHADGDFVYLLPTLSLDGGISATQDYQEVLTSGESPVVMSRELTRRWLTTFVRYGAVEANFLDPFNVEAILGDYAIGAPVADKANDLYSDSVLRPLGLAQPVTSPTGPTDGSTSATKASTRKSRRS